MATAWRPTLGHRLFVGLQYLLPQHTLSRCVRQLAMSRSVPLKNTLIRAFVRHFKPRMHEAVEPDPLRYPSFGEFFARPVKPEARPIEPGPHVVVSPVDGAISQIGQLRGSALIQAKGREFNVEELLAGQPSLARLFQGGEFATLYLAPFDYHRIHMPLGGSLRCAWYVPGRLFSVNEVTAAAVPRLFARNERLVCIVDSPTTTFALVMVGALFVGGMSTVWHGDVTPRRTRRVSELPNDSLLAPRELLQGAEVGRFNMGSTVILLFPPGRIRWDSSLAAGGRLEMGQRIASLQPLK